MGCLSCNNIAPRSNPLASHSIVKCLERFGSLRIGGYVTTLFSVSKATITLTFYLYEFFFNKAINGTAMDPYPRMDLLKYLVSPKKPSVISKNKAVTIPALMRSMLDLS